jgi:hypothetical protein
MTAPLTISEGDAEALLTTAEGVDEEFADLADILSFIRIAGRRDAHRDFSHLIAAAALESRASPVARYAAQKTAAAGWERVARAARPVAVGVAAVFLLVVSSAGLAYAANGAKPGDLLYGLDRAAEAIGIGNGGAAERIEEAQALVAAGETPAGLTHAASVITDTASESAKAAITEAATRLGDGPNSEDANLVNDLLGYLKQTTTTGTIDTGLVSGLAQAIGGPPGGIPPGQENGETAPGNSENAPGQIQGGGTPGTTAGVTEGESQAPGSSGTAPGQTRDKDKAGDGAPGNSGSAPGQTKDDGTTAVTETEGETAPGNSGSAPGQTKDDEEADEAPGNSGSAPGHNSDGGP